MLRKHPRNRGFAWSPPRPPYRWITDEQAQCWDDHGFFLLRGAFTPAEIARVLADIDPIEERVADFLRNHPDRKIFIAEDGNITFTTHLVTMSPYLRDFCRHRVFSGLAHDLIGADVRLYWDQAVYKKPERPREFPWHQDNGYTYIEPQQYLTCWVALTDATVDNGCPWVAPGLHKLGTLEHHMTATGWRCLEDDPPNATAVEATAGSIVVFSSLTPHKTGPNLTASVRKSYIVQFAAEGALAWVDGNEPQPQAAEERQFRVLVNGNPV
jgi:ectoine hydroxylase-related dioxygenase (phytanoyl-CoA dioxygenase family)